MTNLFLEGSDQMYNSVEYNLLLKNPILDDYTNIPVPSNFITNCLGMEIALPHVSTNPFLFSCFAISIDGKLCYPDTRTGFDIACANHHATENEKYADWLYLMFARTISDAVIIGSNFFKKSANRQILDIPIAELLRDRVNSAKPMTMTAIIFCRDINTLDFTHEFFMNHNTQCFIFHSTCAFSATLPKEWNQEDVSTLTNVSCKMKNLLYIDTDFKSIFSKLKQLGCNIILNESPFFHHKLLEQQMLNEIWLNYSGSYIGGDVISLGNTHASFNSHNHPDTEILTLHHLGYNFLYSRQLVKYATEAKSVRRNNHV